MHWERINILLCSRFTTSVPCMLLLLRTIQCLVTKLFALVARKFLFCAVSSSFHGFTGVHFHRIQLLLVIFMCNECRSFSRCQFVSSKLNCTELLNEHSNSLCASMNYYFTALFPTKFSRTWAHILLWVRSKTVL